VLLAFVFVSAGLFGFLIVNFGSLYNKFPNEVKLPDGTSQNAKNKSCETENERFNRL